MTPPTVPIALHRPSELESLVLRIFEQRLGVDVPSSDTDLIDSGRLDSLVLVRLLAALEERLGTRIGLDRLEMSDFRSVSTIAGWLSRNDEGCAA